MIDDRLYTRERVMDAIEKVLSLRRAHPDAHITLEVVSTQSEA